MCLPIDSCFGFGRPPTDDHHHPAPATRGAQHAHHNGKGNGNGGGHYDGNGVHHYNGNGNSYPAHGAAAAGAEADRKAPAQQHAAPTRATDAATRGWQHAHAATGAQEKADGTLNLKQQQPVARNGKAAADGARGGAPAPHNYYSYERAQPQPPAGREREDAAADSYCMAATATAADHGSHSEALGVK